MIAQKNSLEKNVNKKLKHVEDTSCNKYTVGLVLFKKKNELSIIKNKEVRRPFKEVIFHNLIP